MSQEVEPNGRTQEVAIVGGGILGMTLALRLQGQGVRVTLIEAAPVTGGLTQSQDLGGFTWDRFYHVILSSDQHLRGLLEDLGVSHLLQWKTTRTGFYSEGKFHSLSDAVDFLRFRPLSLSDKVRLAATILYASRITNWRRLEEVSVTDWLRRLSGERTFQRIWLPLLKSKLGDNYRIASAAFIWAIIARMYAARRSGLKREMFGYVEGGYHTILQVFRSRLDQLGVRTLCGHAVTGIQDRMNWVEVSLEGRRDPQLRSGSSDGSLWPGRGALPPTDRQGKGPSQKCGVPGYRLCFLVAPEAARRGTTSPTSPIQGCLLPVSSK